MSSLRPDNRGYFESDYHSFINQIRPIAYKSRHLIIRFPPFVKFINEFMNNSKKTVIQRLYFKYILLKICMLLNRNTLFSTR